MFKVDAVSSSSGNIFYVKCPGASTIFNFREKMAIFNVTPAEIDVNLI
jgi:hypothetical protein